MAESELGLPVDIPWKRTAVSFHMLDPDVCDRAGPHPMQPSIAVFEFEPEETAEQAARPFRVSYLKVTCSITTYGATNLDRLRKSLRRVSSPFVFRDSSSFSVSDHMPIDTAVPLDGADLPCFAALLEVSVGPKSGTWPLTQYPYISDFDPKKRELYELVSETGEVMSRSLEEAGVLFGGTTSSSNEVFDKDTFGANQSMKTSVPGHGETSSTTGINVGTESSTRSVAGAEVKTQRTSDASIEKRETYSHTTQLSQMYQLLSSFHLGTNRAVFFLEPRPHIVQTRATFVDGPRQLEGIQEFFLVVVRPRDMPGICVSANLETLHIGTAFTAPPPDPAARVELHLPKLGYNRGWEDPEEDRIYTSDNAVTFPIPPNMELDNSQGGGKGWNYLLNTIVGAGSQARVDVTPGGVTIIGHVVERHLEGGIFEKDDREGGFVEVLIEIFLRPKVAPAPLRNDFAMLASTSVCTCADFEEARRLGKPSIVREVAIPQTKFPVGLRMPVDAAKSWNLFYNQVARSSMSSSDRYPRGEVDFWDLDALRSVRDRTPDLRDVSEPDQKRIATDAASRVQGDSARAYLRKMNVKKLPLREMLKMPLNDLVATTGLTHANATAVRAALQESISKVALKGNRSREGSFAKSRKSKR